MKRRTRRSLILLAALFLLLAALWFSGGLGLALRKYALPLYAPRKVGSHFMVYSFGSKERFEHGARGITLLVSPKRLKSMLSGAFPVLAHYIPPKLFGHGFTAQCMWLPSGEEDSSMGMIPVWILVDDSVGNEPVLKGRMPVDELNRYFAEDVEDSLSSREKWIFGHYTVIYTISFDEVRILSDTGASLAEGSRKLRLDATGRVRIKFDDKPVSARTTAQVKELKSEIDMRFVPRDDGYALSYEAKVTEMRLNVNNVLQWGDRKVAESLRKSLEKSMNRRKNKERGMKLRIPEWAPRDVIVDILLYDDPDLP